MIFEHFVHIFKALQLNCARRLLVLYETEEIYSAPALSLGKGHPLIFAAHGHLQREFHTLPHHHHGHALKKGKRAGEKERRGAV